MSPNNQSNKNIPSPMKQDQTRTHAQKVKQDIQKDVARGEGAMTSREAGSMQD